MAPNAQPTQQAYAKDERVLCFHHELLYEAKVLDSKLSDPSDKKSQMLYRVHYKGWKNTWDDWVSGDRVRKLTDENKELAQNLKKDLDALRKPVPPKTGNQRKKAAGSDLSSNRGSEERQSSAPATGRGQKRGRDNEIEKVGSLDFSSQTSSLLSSTSSNDARSPFLDGLPATGYPSITGKAASSRTTVARNTLQPMRRSLCNTAQLDKVIHTYVPGFSGTSVEEMELVGESNDPSHRSPLELRVYNIDGTCIAIHPARPSPDLLRQDKAIKPPRRHPAMAPINYQDRRNDNKRLFFRGQDPNLRLMIAGVPREGALHPLHAAPASSMPSPPHDRNEMTIGYHDQHINVSTFQEESFHTRPHVRIPCPDNLKSLLVDDWENVTKNLSLVQLPSKTPVNSIIDTYFEEEKGKRRLGSAEADLLEEIVAGVKEYFEKCLGRILLYRFEREQFYEVRNLWEGAVGGPWEGKGPGDVYGAEHLARLFVSMPELIAQTNMDHQSVNRLREEMAKLTQWLGKNASRYFTTEYESATQEYIEKARGV